jgi:NADPH-dependent 2,4-dienoyl-CoA reductase/sulfur reductase-like enzyme
MKTVILGAGPAGLMAAQAALAHGAKVTLVDENPDVGGQIWRGGPAQWNDKRATAAHSAIVENPDFTLLAGARVVARRGQRGLLLESGGGARTLEWERLIICTGARELLLPFPGWTLPGVTGAGALQALIKNRMPVAGKRVVVAGSGPLLLAAAASALAAGAEVAAIIEHRTTRELARFAGTLAMRHRSKFAQAAGLGMRLLGVPYLRGATLVKARGDNRLSGVVVQRGASEIEVDCDFLAAGFGLIPNIELGALFGCVLGDGRISVDSEQRTSIDGVWAAGECTGIGGVDKSIAEGRIAGLRASGAVPDRKDIAARDQAFAFAGLLAQAFAPAPALRAMCEPSTIVCRCEDVRAEQLQPHTDWRNAKLQTRLGMGPCQGRVCGSACQFLYGWQTPEARFPIFPATAATLAAE